MHAAPLYGYNSVVPASSEPLNSSSSVDQQQTPIRTNFNTPEGVYRQAMTVNEYFRTNRMPNPVAGPVCNAPVRVSFLRIPARKFSCSEEAAIPSTSSANKRGTFDDDDFDYSSAHPQNHDAVAYIERICFNIGREIYVFDYSGINGENATPESAKPIDKRVYKGTFPTCHDFHAEGSGQSCLLLIGFSAGQIQLIDPSQKEAPSQQQNSSNSSSSSPSSSASKLFNEERQIDRSAVTCLRWVPDARGQFVAAHASGNLYLYNEELESPQLAPAYQVVKQGEEFTVFASKSKLAKNPVQRWQIGPGGSINAFQFAGPSSAQFMATVSQDGLLRVFNWRSMELVGSMKSYFGGLLCLAWSPDQRYIVTGGEDDLLSLYSLAENRVVCRGQGHKSWVADVAFDQFATFAPSSSANAVNEELGQRESACWGADEVVLVPSPQEPLQNVSSPGCLQQNGWLLTGRKADRPIPGPSNNLAHSSHSNVAAVSNSTSFSAGVLQQGTSNGDGGEPLNSHSRLVYRLGSVGHDCQLCLWDIPEDVLLLHSAASPAGTFNSRNCLTPMDCSAGLDVATSSPSPMSAFLPSLSEGGGGKGNTTVIPIGIDSTISVPMPASNHEQADSSHNKSEASSSKNGSGSGGGRFRRLHKRGFSLGSRLTDRSARQNGGGGSSSNSSAGGAGGPHSVDGTLRRGERLSAQLFGTPQCPRIEECPLIEPLICKKVANERLGSLHFREDCIVTACQEGFICTWARPSAGGRQDGRQVNLSMSDCPNNECHHPQQLLSADNFASTCV